MIIQKATAGIAYIKRFWMVWKDGKEILIHIDKLELFVSVFNGKNLKFYQQRKRMKKSKIIRDSHEESSKNN